MNTAKQAMENMEYVRRLLAERQAGFSASVELAVSFIHRQIEWPGGNAMDFSMIGVCDSVLRAA